MISPQSILSAETVLDAVSGTSRAQLAIETYENSAGMVGDKGIQIWHLLLSLMDLCEVQRSNFDAILKTVEEALAKDKAGKVDTQIFFLLFDLMSFCKAQEIDFAGILANVRAERPIINA